jgi:serine/threonine-protein kinase RsbW
MKVLLSQKMQAKLENLERLVLSVSDCARAQGFDQKRLNEIELSTEEALVNIFNYAYPQGPGDVEITCKLDDSHFIIEIIDSGVPFDVSKLPDPDISLDIDERKIGGLGIFLMRKLMDEVRTTREGGRNILSLVVRKQGKAG